jgi:hypothetical protein
MRRPTRRVAIALVVVVTAFTAVVAFASSLSLSSNALQAGSTSVGQVCTGTIATSFTTAGVDTSGNPLIQYVSLNPAAGVCTNGTGYNVTVYLEKGTGPSSYSALGSGMTATAVTIAAATTFTAASGTGVTIVAASILQLDFSSQNLKVSDLSSIAVVIV